MANTHASLHEEPSDAIALTAQLCDMVLDLSFALNAFLALERFVSPDNADELNTSVAPSRLELSGMLHTLNSEIQRQIAALTHMTAVLHEQAANLIWPPKPN